MFISITPLESGVQSLDVKVSTDKGIVTQNTYSHNVKEQTKLFPILFGVVLAVIVIIVVLFILSRLRE